MQLQVKPVEMKVVEGSSLHGLADAVNKFLSEANESWILHGDIIDRPGGFAQAIVRTGVVAMPEPSMEVLQQQQRMEARAQSAIVRPG